MIRTRVGYAGGTAENPDYGHIGDHTETVQVDYDPARISYERLLEIFWQSHRPDERNWSRQYMNAVFFHDERQKAAAEASKAALEKRSGQKARTQMLPVRSFTLAEDYHQKYLLKRHGDLKREMSRIYPNHRELVDSTAAARLNGYAGGHGGPERLAREIDMLGLSPAGRKALQSIVKR